MLFFGHIGITAGVTKACDTFLFLAQPDNNQESGSGSKITSIIEQQLRRYPLLGKIKSQTGQIDYRLTLAGSLLPDIIDKPIFFLIGSNASLSGRDYAHTLLFNLVLLISGLVLTRYRKSWLLIISLSSFVHLVLDQIWDNPVTLLWPLLGPLARGETAGWLSDRWHRLFTYPGVYIPEIIGLVILLLFAYKLVKGKAIINFIREGTTG